MCDKFYFYDYLDWCRHQKFYSSGNFLEENDKKLVLSQLSRVLCTIVTPNKKRYFVCENELNKFVEYNKTDFKRLSGIGYNIVHNKRVKGINTAKKISHSGSELKDEAELETDKIICTPYHNDEIPIVGFNIFHRIKASRLDCNVTVDSDEYGEIKPILDHMWNVWAKRDQEKYNFIHEYFSHIIQNLSRTNICLTFRGKDFCTYYILDFMSKYIFNGFNLFGSIKLAVDHHHGNAGLTLVIIEEDYPRREKSLTMDKFTGRVCEPTIEVRNGTRPAFKVDNCTNYIILSETDVGPTINSPLGRSITLEVDHNCNNEYNNEIQSCFNQRTANILYTYFLFNVNMTNRDIEIPGTLIN